MEMNAFPTQGHSAVSSNRSPAVSKFLQAASEPECAKKYERDNFTWEKMKMVEEYLQNSQNFSHVMILDADAALVRDHDILGKMAAELHAQHRDVFFTNEDWLWVARRGSILASFWPETPNGPRISSATPSRRTNAGRTH
ncbi:unnamed protein product [Effrenium voratum]|nr:unnamed protein product [Effrenium voratum]